MIFYHTPILADRIIQFLNIQSHSVIADLTTGEGGHSALIAPLIPDGRLICLDRDQEILMKAKERLIQYPNVSYICDTYDKITELRQQYHLPLFDGILVDMGISMFHFKGAERGFSFDDSTLDMRLDHNQSLSAQEVINTFSEENLADIFYYYGEERYSRRIAREIVKRRPFTSAKDLSTYILQKIGRHGKIHPATKIFQGLRIYVNKELEIAEKFLQKIVDNLAINGVVCFLTFHSLEDRLIKKSLQSYVSSGRGILPITKPCIPTSNEQKKNPAARSAKLRVFKRIDL